MDDMALALQFGRPTGALGLAVAALMTAANRDDYRGAIDRLPFHPQGRLLEVGCGDGGCAGMFLHSGRCGAYLGIDHAPDVIEQAREHHRGNAAMRFVCVDVEAIPGDETFDAAVALNTVQWWPDLSAGLASVAARLAPGGVLVIGVAIPPERYDFVHHPDAAELAAEMQDAGLGPAVIERMISGALRRPYLFAVGRRI